MNTSDAKHIEKTAQSLKDAGFEVYGIMSGSMGVEDVDSWLTNLTLTAYARPFEEPQHPILLAIVNTPTKYNWDPVYQWFDKNSNFHSTDNKDCVQAFDRVLDVIFQWKDVRPRLLDYIQRTKDR